MSFLMKHYEKIIFTIFLVIFLSLLIYLLMIFSQSSTVKPEDLKLPNRKADHINKNFEDPQYNLSVEIVKNCIWLDSKPREKDDKAFTDFMKCFLAAKCVNPSCKRVIPLIFFEEAPLTCPLCSAKLPKIDPTGKLGPGGVAKDTDKDGIPDDIELKYGLSQTDSEDAMDDLDNDGFTNLDEFRYKPEGINNPKIHPPYAWRLKLDSIIRTKLSIVLKRVKDMGDENDKSKWELHFKLKNPKTQAMDDTFSKIGDVINVDGDKYKIVDVNRKFEEKFNKSIGGIEKKDKSEVIIEQVDTGDKVTLVMNEQVFAPREKVIIRDIFTQIKYTVSNGKDFQAGSKETGFEKYIVNEVIPDKKVVKIKLDGSDNVFDITEKTKASLPRNTKVSGDAAKQNSVE